VMFNLMQALQGCMRFGRPHRERRRLWDGWQHE
jgi:hypothetical protein